MTDYKILAIVVTFNGMKWVERCINSLIESSVTVDIFIVDNGSIDGTREYIQARFPDILIYFSNKNLGFGKANNLGLKYGIEKGYDYIYLMNQDAWIENDTLENLVKTHQNNKEFGIISPMQMNNTKTAIDKNLLANLNPTDCPEFLSDLYIGKCKEVYSLRFVMAAHWLISADCLKKVGGFAPIFKQYGEDNDYINRVFYHELKVGLAAHLRVVHDRESRVESKKSIFNLIFPNFLSIACNINVGLFNGLIKGYLYLFKRSIWFMLKYKSLKSLYLILKSIPALVKIVKNRKLSLLSGAFLK